MMTSNVRIATLQRQFKECVEDALRLCSETRRGDSQLSVTRIESIARPRHVAPLSVAILPLSSSTRTKCLRWLLREHSRKIERLFDAGAPTADLPLDTVEGDTVFSAPTRNDSSVASPGLSCHSLNLRMAATPADLQASASAYVTFCARSQVLVLVAEDKESMSELDAMWLAELMNCFDVAWLWVFVSSDDVSPSAVDALQRELASLSETTLVKPIAIDLSSRLETSLLARPNSDLRELLHLISRVRSLDAIVSTEATIKSCYGDDLKLRLANLEEQRKGRRSGQKSAFDAHLTQASELLAQKVKHLEDRLSLRNDQLLQAKGKYPIELAQLIEGITFAHLDHRVIEGENTYELTGSQISNIERAVAARLSEQVREDVFHVCLELNDFVPKLFRSVKLVAGETIKLEFAPPSAQGIWTQLQGLVHFEHGEQVTVPRLTLGTLLSKTRQRVFMVLMFGLILGRIGIQLANSVPPEVKSLMTGFGIALLVVSAVLVVIDHRKSTRKLQKLALDKMHEALLRDGMKLVEGIQKEKVKLLKALLQQLQSKINTHLLAVFGRARDWQQQIVDKDAEWYSSRKASLSMESSEAKRNSDDFVKLRHRVNDLLTQFQKSAAELAQRQEVNLVRADFHTKATNSSAKKQATAGECAPLDVAVPAIDARNVEHTSSTDASSASRNRSQHVPSDNQSPPVRSSFAERRRRRLESDPTSNGNGHAN